MDHNGLMNKLLDRLYSEKLNTDVEAASSLRQATNDDRAALLALTKDAGATKDIDLILKVEKAYIVNDLNLYGNSADMRGSLSEALAGLQQTERMVDMVRDPARYAVIDEAHGLKKSRKSGLPYDDARKFFPAQVMRLRNMDKSRLSNEEKTIVNQRQHNLRTAERVYTSMQRNTLGVEAPTATPSRGIERE